MSNPIDTISGWKYIETDPSWPVLGKKKILQTFDNLSLPQDGYFVIGGANLVLRDIKPATPDVDMLVSSDVFDILKRLRNSIVKEPPEAARLRGADNKTVWVKNDHTPVPISATTMLGDGYYPMSFESHKDRTELISGVQCLELDQVVLAKEALQRLKDVDDLEAIARFMGRSLNLSKPILIEPIFES